MMLPFTFSDIWCQMRFHQVTEHQANAWLACKVILDCEVIVVGGTWLYR